MTGRRIFLVEDEPIIASGIERKITQLGYEVAGSAVSGEAAIRAVDANRPDLILMDIKLEGALDGIETAAEIHKRHDVPVIFLTAYADEATLDRATRQDPFAYIVKPFTDRELFGAIEVGMHRYELHRDLREHAERYRMLSEVLSDFAFSITLAGDPEKEVLEWSVGDLHALIGVTTETVRSFEDILYVVHPEDLTHVRAFWTDARRGSGGGIEFRVIRGERQIEWIRMDAAVSRSPAGDNRLYGALKNVTRLRETQHRLEEREFEFSRIVQTMRQGVWVGDSSNLCIYANQGLCDMTGYSREEIVGRNSLAVLVGEQPASPDQVEPHEIQLRTKDGRDLTVLVTPRVVADSDGTFRGSINLIVDVTRQKRSLELITKSKRKLEGVFHASPAASLLIDSATTAVLDVNRAFVAMTGFDRDAIVGRGGFGLADYEDLDELNRMVSLLKAAGLRTDRIRLRSPRGESRLFDVEVREVVVEDESLLLVILAET